MKVRLFLQGTIEDFANHHASGKKLFASFLTVIKNAEWEEPGDITKTVKGNLLSNGSDRVVFDIGGIARTLSE